MPIDIQCPDCEHVFGVPSSMAGKRTLCRGCNAALIVPDEAPAELPLEEAPVRPSKRIAPVEEKPPNWDTPIPFRSPGPIVGVLLIALLASTLILIGYGIARSPTVATKSLPYSAGPKPAEPTYPAPMPLDPKPTLGYEREVILPNQELIASKFTRGSSARRGGPFQPKNWFVVTAGSHYQFHERARGNVVATLTDPQSRIVERTATASPSGRWFAAVTHGGTTVELFDAANGDEPLRKWKPYDSQGRFCESCAVLSDDRLLTVSARGSCDLWAIPSGEYIRRVAHLDPDGSNLDVSYDKMQLAIRKGGKLEIHSLDDDEFGPLCEFTLKYKPFDAATFRCRFTPDGKRLVAVTEGSTIKDEFFGEVEVFDIAARKRTAAWVLSMNGHNSETFTWCPTAESLLVHLHSPGSVSQHRLADGKLETAIECSVPPESVVLDGDAQRVLFWETERSPARVYGFELPLRTPSNLQKNPVWEYKSGVLELKKPVR